MNFKEYRQKAYEYMKNKCIIENNIKILEEQGIFVKQWGESSGTLEIKQGMTTKEMKVIEDEYNVCFALGVVNLLSLILMKKTITQTIN